MRVAMLLTNRFTTDARVQREARTVASLGHELVVHALAGPGLPADEERDGYRVRRHAEPAWIGWTGARRAWPLLRWYSRYAFLAAAAGEGRPEIVHAHDLETLLPGGRLARRLGARFVYDDHELGLEKLGQGTAEWLRGPRRWASDAFTAYLRARGAALEGKWIRRADALVTACPMYGEVLESRYGVPPVVLCNTPLRSDLPPDPRLRERAGLPPAARVALYQGTITPAGGADECIDAAARFPEGWSLVFLGVTWMRGRLEDRARRAGAAERVRFLDPVPPSELPGWTRAADAGLAPIKPLNKGQAYSLANKLFEYMHAGIPQIVSDIPAQAALVRDERAGIVLPEVSADAIARAVAEIAAVPEAERRADGERLRARARERWCWEVEGRKLEELYRRLAGENTRRAAGAGADAAPTR